MPAWQSQTRLGWHECPPRINSKETMIMRNVALAVPLALLVAACGSSDGAPSSAKKSSSPGDHASASSESGELKRPTLKEGYTRFETLKVDDIQPGDDITRCQYVMAPFDRDMDVMDITGLQSKMGHH